MNPKAAFSMSVPCFVPGLAGFPRNPLPRLSILAVGSFLVFLICGTGISAGSVEATVEAGGEVGLPLPDCLSEDKVMGVVITVRKEGQPAAPWPTLFPDVERTSTPADAPGYTTAAWVVNFADRTKLASIPGYGEVWANHGVTALWGPDQEGWRYGLLDVDARFGTQDLLVVNSDGTEARFIAIRDLLDKKVGKTLTAAGLNAAEYAINYTPTKFLNAGEVAVVSDAITAEITYTAEVPKSDQPVFDGRLHLTISRDARGRATAEIVGFFPEGVDTAGESPAAGPASDLRSDEDFAAFRARWNARAKEDQEWRSVRVDLPPGESGGKRFVVGWLEANVLQRLLYVDSRGVDDETVTVFYWTDGLLTSVFEVRSGAATGISDVGEATEIYNFRGENLVNWHRTGDSSASVDPTDPGFGPQGAEIRKQSLELAAPVYEKIGAD